ncbi:MAG TPA: extracellular solute-binding protein [Streptosporangiaceae bacterium]
MRVHRFAATVTAMAAAGSMLAACGSSPGSGSGESITLYSGQHVQTTQSLVSGFTAATGIKVSLRSDDEDTLADQIVAEGSHSPADVLFTENSPPLEFLQGKGLLAKVDAATLARTPGKYSSPGGDWVGVSARVSVIIYNPSLIKESQLPATTLQLASPRYRDKLAIAPSETDFQPIVTAMARSHGTAATLRWLAEVKSNAASHSYPDNETLSDQVNRGAVAFGVINQYYWYRMRAQLGAASVHSAIAHFAAGDPGYVVDVSGAAVLKSSTHQAAAQRFLAYLVSKAGQDVIANPAKSISFEYPVGSGVTTLAPETPLSELRPYPISVAQLGTGLPAISLLKQAGLL